MVLACTILLVSRECGGCGSSRLPGGKPAVETFADYIDGKVEFETISSIYIFSLAKPPFRVTKCHYYDITWPTKA